MNEEIFIARQPILDKNQAIMGYELLFRRMQNKNNSNDILDDLEATTQVLDNAMNNIGVDKLVGKHKAFVNCSYELLKSDLLYVLNQEAFIIEILENVEIDDVIVEAVKNFKSKGFKIAVDDFVPSLEAYKKIVPLLPYVDIVKLEYPEISAKELKRAVEFFHRKNITVLAEKLETEADFKKCFEANCDLFQGYFFAKPEMLGASKISPDVAGTLELIKAVDSSVEINELEHKFKMQPELSVNLVKYLNSAAFAKRQEITSIGHAITLLGYDNLKRWLILLVYANKGYSSARNSPLLTNAVYRATFFENIMKLASSCNKDFADKAYLMGLVSNLDAFYRLPMEAILSQLSLSGEINEALLHEKGDLGDIMKLERYLEMDNTLGAEEIAKKLGLSMQHLSSCMLKAYEASNNGLGDI